VEGGEDEEDSLSLSKAERRKRSDAVVEGHRGRRGCSVHVRRSRVWGSQGVPPRRESPEERAESVKRCLRESELERSRRGPQLWEGWHVSAGYGSGDGPVGVV
jgi:hypothetical protein